MRPVCEAMMHVVDILGCMRTNAAPGGNGTGGIGMSVLRSKTLAR